MYERKHHVTKASSWEVETSWSFKTHDPKWVNNSHFNIMNIGSNNPFSKYLRVSNRSAFPNRKHTISRSEYWLRKHWLQNNMRGTSLVPLCIVINSLHSLPVHTKNNKVLLKCDFFTYFGSFSWNFTTFDLSSRSLGHVMFSFAGKWVKKSHFKIHLRTACLLQIMWYTLYRC